MILVAIPFLAFAAALVLAGLSQTFNAQHGHSSDGGFISYWENAVKDIASTILSPLTKAARYVVSRFAASQFRALTAYLTSMAALWRAEFRAMRAEAEATKNVAQALERAIPVEAKKAAAPAFRLGKVNARQLAKFRAEVKPAIARLSTAADVTLPRDIARVRRREEALSRDQAKLRERTTSLENGAVNTFDWIRTHPLSAVSGVFAGAVAVALGRLGLGALRCSNFTNLLSRFGCGLGSLLDGLLGLVISGLVLTNICDMLGLLETAYGDVAGPLISFLTEIPLGGCEVPPKSWAQLAVAAGPLPPPQTLGALPV